MLMVNPDLEKFKLINSVCAASADIKMKDVEDFIEKYDEIRRRYDSTKRETKAGFVNCSMLNTGARRPKGFLSSRKASGCHYCLGMPDGSMLGLYVCDGENKRNKIKNFINHWIDVTGKDPVMYGHKISKDKCPLCGGEIHYKNGHSWCIDCKHIFK
ncbi:MAG: hypothetical protein MJ217_01750 [Bacilli bacterium]|nr:hypothetical protein [Bacilli bacterium]